MHQLLPGPLLENPDLAKLYEYPPGRWLRANMVASADGAATLDGASSGLSSGADRHVFALLRTLADVIVVGASTARTERYAPVRRHELWHHLREGRPATPPIAVVSARLDLDPAGRLIASAPPYARTIVITTAAAPPERRAELAERADVIVAGQETVDLTAAVDALADRGHRRLLTEGGPHLLSQLAAADLLDELCLTIGPLLAGPAASRIVAGTISPARPLPLALAHVLQDNGFLLCRYTIKDHLSERPVVRTQGKASCTVASVPLAGPPVRTRIGPRSGMWRHCMSEGCVFCDQSWMREAEIFIETPHCIFASTRDPDIRARAGLAEGVLPGSGAIVPIAHRTSVFELTPAEWADTRDLLLLARMALHDLLAPDGYLLGWNQGGVLHPHMHVIPRFDDEPLSDRWLRSAINAPEDRRPDPWAPGSGRALRGAR